MIGFGDCVDQNAIDVRVFESTHWRFVDARPPCPALLPLICALVCFTTAVEILGSWARAG